MSDLESNVVGIKAKQATRKVLAFEIREGGVSARSVRFDKHRLVLGSVISADVRVSGEGISPIHSVIEQQSDTGSVVIYDLASETGTFVNGKRVITETLSPGDEITLGTAVIKIQFEDPSRISKQEILGESSSQRLILSASEDLKPLLLEDEREVLPIFDFRPESSQALEVILSWYGTILDIEHFTEKKDVTVGTSRDADFGIPLTGSDKHPFVTTAAGGYTLNVLPGMTGVIQRKGKVTKIQDIARDTSAIPIGPTDFAKVSIGEVDFYLSQTAAPPRLKNNRLFERDLFFFKIFSASMLMTALTIFALMKADLPEKINAEEVPERIATILYQPERFVPKQVSRAEIEEAPKVVAQIPKPKTPPPLQKIDLKPKAEPPKTPAKQIGAETKTETTKPSTKNATKTVAKQQAGQNQAKEGEGARAKGPEGTRGAKNAAPAPEKQNMASRPSAESGKGRGAGASQVSDEGNVDFLKGSSSKILDLLGNSGANLGKGGNKLKGFGGFTSQGGGGLALSGEGSGGGGTADTTLGGLGNKGRGGGRVGTGLGASGTGTGIIGGATRVVIRSGGPEEAVVMGSIDASAVEAALLAHRDEFRNCYEQEINRGGDPSLAGRVGTIFVIGASGAVSSAGIQSSTLKNPNVERCVVGVIKRIAFPEPAGGGRVQVTYPFKFSPVGG